jgi:hypothetical protein
MVVAEQRLSILAPSTLQEHSTTIVVGVPVLTVNTPGDSHANHDHVVF